MDTSARSLSNDFDVLEYQIWKHLHNDSDELKQLFHPFKQSSYVSGTDMIQEAAQSASSSNSSYHGNKLFTKHTPTVRVVLPGFGPKVQAHTKQDMQTNETNRNTPPTRIPDNVLSTTKALESPDYEDVFDSQPGSPSLPAADLLEEGSNGGASTSSGDLHEVDSLDSEPAQSPKNPSSPSTNNADAEINGNCSGKKCATDDDREVDDENSVACSGKGGESDHALQSAQSRHAEARRLREQEEAAARAEQNRLNDILQMTAKRPNQLCVPPASSPMTTQSQDVLKSGSNTNFEQPRDELTSVQYSRCSDEQRPSTRRRSASRDRHEQARRQREQEEDAVEQERLRLDHILDICEQLQKPQSLLSADGARGRQDRREMSPDDPDMRATRIKTNGSLNRQSPHAPRPPPPETHNPTGGYEMPNSPTESNYHPISHLPRHHNDYLLSPDLPRSPEADRYLLSPTLTQSTASHELSLPPRTHAMHPHETQALSMRHNRGQLKMKKFTSTSAINVPIQHTTVFGANRRWVSRSTEALTSLHRGLSLPDPPLERPLIDDIRRTGSIKRSTSLSGRSLSGLVRMSRLSIDFDHLIQSALESVRSGDRVEMLQRLRAEALRGIMRTRHSISTIENQQIRSLQMEGSRFEASADSSRITQLQQQQLLAIDAMVAQRSDELEHLAATRQHISDLEAELLYEQQNSGSSQRALKLADAVETQRKRYDDLEFQQLENETQHEEERERLEQQLIAEQEALLAKLRRTQQLNGFSNVEQVRAEVSRMERERHALLETLRREKNKLAAVERRMRQLGLDERGIPLPNSLLQRDVLDDEMLSSMSSSVTDSSPRPYCRADFSATGNGSGPLRSWNADEDSSSLPGSETTPSSREISVSSSDEYPVNNSHRRPHNSHSKQLRPLTRYLPILEPSYDLKQHVESNGHDLVNCPHIAVTSTTCRGYLYKLGFKLRTWKKRWFVVDRGFKSIMYYPDKSESRRKGCILFTTIQDVYRDTRGSGATADVMCIKTRDRTFRCRAPSEQALRVWLDVVATAAEGYRPST